MHISSPYAVLGSSRSARSTRERYVSASLQCRTLRQGACGDVWWRYGDIWWRYGDVWWRYGDIWWRYGDVWWRYGDIWWRYGDIWWRYGDV